MTLLIAHRGLILGPNQEIENHPNTILSARRHGYDVEIDIWYENDAWYLGHDNPQYEIGLDWLRSVDRRDYLDQHHAWIHAKNIPALFQLRKLKWEGHLFYHQNDDVVITSTGYLWTYPGKTLTPLSICVMPEWTDAMQRISELDVLGYCSDHVGKLAELISNRSLR
jgi:hypothetical protein